MRPPRAPWSWKPRWAASASSPSGDLQPEDIADGIPPEIDQLIEENLPGVTLDVEEAGTGILDEDTVGFRYDLHVVTSTHVNAATIREVLNVMCENVDEIGDAHVDRELELRRVRHGPVLRSLPRRAIQFYEEQGAWSDDLQQQHDELLEGAEG